MANNSFNKEHAIYILALVISFALFLTIIFSNQSPYSKDFLINETQTNETNQFDYLKFSNDIELEQGHMYAIASADFNKDGLRDIVLGNFNRNNYYFINKGNKEFEKTVEFGSGNTEDFAAADFNNDNFIDLAVAKYGENSEIYINNDGYTFESTLALGNHYTRTFSAEDFNGDGNMDVFVGADGENFVYFGNGDFTFTEQKLPGTLHTMSSTAADFDNDGDLDIAIGTDFQKNYLYINSGAGDFIFMPLPGDKYHTYAVDACDLNNDNYADLIIGNNNQNSETQNPNYIYLNNHDLTFTIIPEFGSYYTYAVKCADFNNDGKMDVALGNYNQQSKLYINNGEMKFYSQDAFGFGYARAIIAADFNNDQLLDLAVAKDITDAIDNLKSKVVSEVYLQLNGQ